MESSKRRAAAALPCAAVLALVAACSTARSARVADAALPKQLGPSWYEACPAGQALIVTNGAAEAVRLEAAPTDPASPARAPVEPLALVPAGETDTIAVARADLRQIWVRPADRPTEPNGSLRRVSGVRLACTTTTPRAGD